MSEPISATRILCKIAAMAAGGLPVPKLTSINEGAHSVNLHLRNIADVRAWSDALGVPESQSREHTHEQTRYHSASRDWHGWYIATHADEPAAPLAEEIPADDPDLAVVLAHADDEATG